MHTAAQFWDKIAEKYAAQPVKDPAAFERKQVITRQHLRPDARVLELGCGTGSLALAMAPSAGHIDALDVSAEMIRIAQRKQQVAGINNVTFRQGVLDNTTFEPASFDCVWAYSILHLVPERTRVLTEIFTLLKPGGVFISSNVCLGGSWVPYSVLIAVMRWFNAAPVVYFFDRTTVQREIQAAGFAEAAEHDVGAESTVAFMVAKKPARAQNANAGAASSFK